MQEEIIKHFSLNSLNINQTNINTLNSEEKKKLHLDFGCENSLISVKKQPSIEVSTLEVVLFILLVEVIHLKIKWQGYL